MHTPTPANPPTDTDDSTSTTLALGATLAQHAIASCEAVRAINHATITRPPLPAPIAYELLGAFSRLGSMLDQALGQVGTGLAASLEAPGLFAVYEADGSDPATSVANARAAIAIACRAADDMATSAEYAQGQLAWQGFRPAQRVVAGAAASMGGEAR